MGRNYTAELLTKGKVWKRKNRVGRLFNRISNVVREGLKWEIGDGNQIHVLEEPRIDNFPLVCSPTLHRNVSVAAGCFCSFLYRGV